LNASPRKASNRLALARLLALAEAALTAAVQVGEPGQKAAMQLGAADRLAAQARKLRAMRHDLDREANPAAVRLAWLEGWDAGKATAARLAAQGDDDGAGEG
jgi:hypothetical protein